MAITKPNDKALQGSERTLVDPKLVPTNPTENVYKVLQTLPNDSPGQPELSYGKNVTNV